MPQTTAATSTFNVAGNREHLMDAIYRIAQQDAPFTTKICSRMSAEAKLVEWQTDDLRAPNANNASIEGANAGAPVTQNTVRVGNRTQLFEAVAQVSTTQQSVKTAGRSSEMKYQISTQMKNLMLDVEAASVSPNPAVVGDASTTASKLRGLESWISTNAFHGASGATNASTGVVTDGTQRALSKTLIDNTIQAVFDAGGQVDTIMVGSGGKRNASAALNGTVNNRQVTAQDKTIVDAVDVYMSDFGTIRLMPNRTQRNRTLFALDSSKHAMAWLQNLQSTPLAKIGHSDREMVFGETTYVCRNQVANGKLADLT